MPVACVSAFFAVLACLPIPFIDDFYICISILWVLLFFGGFMLPILTGILLNSVEPL
jgi:hypothetical protein